MLLFVGPINYGLETHWQKKSKSESDLTLEPLLTEQFSDESDYEYTLQTSDVKCRRCSSMVELLPPWE